MIHWNAGLPVPAEQHYAACLAPIYAWMVGDFESACDASARFFDELSVRPRSTGRAVDLGSGHGVQTIPLARRGFAVTAIDSSDLLLQELRARAGTLPVRTIHDDLLRLARHVDAPVDLITCMGDTLTHLASPQDVWRVLDTAAALLAPGGMLVLSFRDYASVELRGSDRFIPVRSDEARIHTCFLEYLDEVVHVHDIVQTRSSAGWLTSVSAYPKLRLAPAAVLRRATTVGLTAQHESVRHGMLHLAFRSAPDHSQ
jgi:SAM-dependent methyltransferase